MTPPEFTKRDFLKAAGLTALTYGWNSFHPAPAFAGAVHPLSIDPDPSWNKIRGQFPLSHDRVYFNNGTLGPSPAPVIAAVVAAMNRVESTGETLEADDTNLRAKLAQFVGAKSEEISLTHNTSEGVNIIAEGLRLVAGDEVVITTHEHVGNALPWLNRARISGVVLKSFIPPPTALAVLREIESRVTGRTRVIAIPHVSCTTGQVFPLAEIVALAKSQNILVFVDGAHGTGMFPLHLNTLGVDFYSSSTHKWLCGPKGVGYLYVRSDRIDAVEPRFVGAHSDTGWHLDTVPPRIDGFNPTAHRFDFGSQNTALHVGAVAAIDFFTRIGQSTITDHGCALALQLQNSLITRASDIEMLTPTEARSRAMMVSFRFRDPAKDAVKFAAYADHHGFRVRQVSEAGLNAVRISTHLYNTADEVSQFVALVDAFRGHRPE